MHGDPLYIHNDLPAKTIVYMEGDAMIENESALADSITLVATRAFNRAKDVVADPHQKPSPGQEGKQLTVPDNSRFAMAEASPEEAEEFESLIAYFNAEPAILESGPLATFLDIPAISPEDVVLKDGSVISTAEQVAIFVYTTDHYRLVNGMLDGDVTSLADWQKENPLEESIYRLTQSMVRAGTLCEEVRETGNASAIDSAEEHLAEVAGWLASAHDFEESFDDYFTKLEEIAEQVAFLASSGINKLPKYEGLLFRGEAIPMQKLEEWRSGHPTMLTRKFFSCSTRMDISEGFARRSASEYMKDLEEPYVPVLNIFQSTRSHDISSFSFQPDEDEKVYVPGQAFQLVRLDETTVPGLAIGFWKERNG